MSGETTNPATFDFQMQFIIFNSSEKVSKVTKKKPFFAIEFNSANERIYVSLDWIPISRSQCVPYLHRPPTLKSIVLFIEIIDYRFEICLCFWFFLGMWPCVGAIDSHRTGILANNIFQILIYN